VAIVKEGEVPPDWPLPDGFDEMARHNLITFKSHQEALSRFSLFELVGHYVNYRKQAGPSVDEMPAEEELRLFAVCVRYPQGLEEHGTLVEVQEGVYEVPVLRFPVRVIVASRLPMRPNNAFLLMFSPNDEHRRYGAENYRVRSGDGSTILLQLFQGLRKEGFNMPYTVEDMRRDGLKTALEIVSIEEVMQAMPVEKRLEGIPVEKRLEGVPAEKRLVGLPVEDQLKALSPEALEALRRRLAPEPPKDTP
jgi:hypothetical protein